MGDMRWFALFLSILGVVLAKKGQYTACQGSAYLIIMDFFELGEARQACEDLGMRLAQITFDNIDIAIANMKQCAPGGGQWTAWIGGMEGYGGCVALGTVGEVHYNFDAVWCPLNDRRAVCEPLQVTTTIIETTVTTETTPSLVATSSTRTQTISETEVSETISATVTTTIATTVEYEANLQMQSLTTTIPESTTTTIVDDTTITSAATIVVSTVLETTVTTSDTLTESQTATQRVININTTTLTLSTTQTVTSTQTLSFSTTVTFSSSSTVTTSTRTTSATSIATETIFETETIFTSATENETVTSAETDIALEVSIVMFQATITETITETYIDSTNTITTLRTNTFTSIVSDISTTYTTEIIVTETQLIITGTKTVTTTTATWNLACPTSLISPCPNFNIFSSTNPFQLLTKKVPRHLAKCACEQHGWKLAGVGVSNMMDASNVLNKCARSMMPSAWIGKNYAGEQMQCPVIFGGALPGSGTIGDDCRKDLRYVLCEMPECGCRCPKNLKLLPRVLKNNPLLKSARQNGACATSYGGIHLITDILSYADAQTVCQETNSEWELMEVTNANLPNLSQVVNECMGDSYYFVWVSSFEGFGIPKNPTGFPCGGLYDFSDGTALDFSIYIEEELCQDDPQMVACSSRSGPVTTSSGPISQVEASTKTEITTETEVLTTTITIATVRFTDTSYVTLAKTTSTTTTTPVFSVSVSILPPSSV